METTPPTNRPAPWALPEFFDRSPDGSAYGYRSRGTNHSAAEQELIERVRSNSPRVDMVWTPQSPYLVLPVEAPSLRPVLQPRAAEDLRARLKYSFLALGAWIAILILNRGPEHAATHSIYLFLALIFGLVPVIQDGWAILRLRRDPDRFLLEAATTVRYQIWLGERRIITTKLLAACMIAIGLLQLITPHFGTEAAGLIKQLVRENGEWWRLLTCAFLHGGSMHFVFNFIALIALGRLVEVHGHPLYVPIIFILSALAGSITSLYAMPHTDSVGASGGIMGMIGFLAILGIRRRNVMPAGFLKSIVLSIALTAAAGVVAHSMIDNAAHAGGLACGLILGIIYVTRRTTEFRLKPSKPARIAGILCTGAVVLVAAFTAFKLIAARLAVKPPNSTPTTSPIKRTP